MDEENFTYFEDLGLEGSLECLPLMKQNKNCPKCIEGPVVVL